MGLEGAVRLGFKKELEAVPEGDARDALYEKLVADMYEKGRATEAAAYLEIDMVIDPRKVEESSCGHQAGLMQSSIVQATDCELIACELAHHPYTV